MGFMEAQLIEGDFALVETHGGESWELWADVLDWVGRVTYRGRRDFELIAARALEHRPEGAWMRRGDEVKRVVVRTRWASRLSAPGYMDCTDWNVAETAAGALEALRDAYGDECEVAYEIAALAAEAGLSDAEGKGEFQFETCESSDCSFCGEMEVDSDEV